MKIIKAQTKKCAAARREISRSLRHPTYNIDNAVSVAGGAVISLHIQVTQFHPTLCSRENTLRLHQKLQLHQFTPIT